MATPAYRLRVYAPRSVDATESTLLTPRPGADHSDPFRVASVQGVTGYQPYLTELPRGKRSSIDPLSKKTDIGFLTFVVGDKRLGTDNLVRWVTAFVGDGAGEDTLKGRRVEVDESLDFDPANPGAATWTRYFTGRIVHPRLRGRLEIELVVHEMTDDLEATVFATSPYDTGVGTYAHQSQLYPLGLLHPYGPFPTVAKARGFVAAPQLVGHDSFSLVIDPTQPDTRRLVAPRVLIETLTSSNPRDVLKHLLVVKRLDTGVETRWCLPRAIRWGTSLEHLAVASYPGLGPQVVPPVGTAVEFYVQPVDYPVSDKVPLLINDVHPATLIRHLLAGYYGRLVDGAPAWSVPIEPSSFAAIEADTTFVPWRSIERGPAKLNETIERICQVAHLAYYPNASGQIVLVDLRRKSTIVPVAAITTADLASDRVPSWEPDATQAVTSVTATYYIERQLSDEELPKPFEQLRFGEYARDKAPDIAPVRIVDDRTNLVRVEQGGPRVGDVRAGNVDVEARGLRFALTGAPDVNGLPTVQEQLNGQPRSLVIENYLAAMASELRAPYTLGPTYISLGCKRSAVAACAPGSHVSVQVAELPDPASVRRGGVRLALVTGRTEDGPVVTLDLLDVGSSGVAVTPTLGAPATVTGDVNALTCAVTLNAAGDPVQLQIAVTAKSVGTRPAESSPLWVNTTPITTGAATPLVTASGTATIDRIAGNSRVWVRGRSVPSAGAGFKLPSSWAFPAGSGFVDLATIPAPTGLVVTQDDGRALLTWTPGDSTHRLEVFLVEGGVPGSWTTAMRQARLNAGSTRWRTPRLKFGQGYAVAVCAIDEFGGTSTFVTATFTASTTGVLDPPVYPTAFACSQDDNGVITVDGTYGLAVVAAVVPGEVEFAESVETAVGSDTYGAAATIGRVRAVVGGWTRIVRSAPNDGLRRRLVARSVVDPATPSAYTDPVTVLPWTPLALPPLPTQLVVTITGLPPDDPADEGAVMHFQAGCVDPLGSPCEVAVFALSDGVDIADGPAVGEFAPNDTDWTVTLPASGPGLLTIRGRAADGRTVDLTISLPPRSAGTNALVMRVHKRTVREGKVTLDVYVADPAPSPDAPIVVHATSQGVTAVASEMGSRSAFLSSRGTLITQPHDVSAAPWGGTATVEFDAAKAGPTGRFGASKVTAASAAQGRTYVFSADANVQGVEFSGECWLCADSPISVTLGLRRGDGTPIDTAAVTTVALTPGWQRFVVHATASLSTAGSGWSWDVRSASGGGTWWVWGNAVIRGTFAAVTDDLDTTDYVPFEVTPSPARITGTNLVLQSDRLATAPWQSGGGSPAATDDAATFGGVSYTLIENSTTGPWGQRLSDVEGVHTIRARLHAFPGFTGVVGIGVFDQTAAAARGFVHVKVRADGSMVPFSESSGGKLLELEALEDGQYRVCMRTAALTGGNNHFFYAAVGSGSAPMKFYISKYQIHSGPDAFPYEIETRDRRVTQTFDASSGLVSFMARRAGYTPAVVTVPIEPSAAIGEPDPQITLEAEGTAHDGALQGRVRLIVRFDAKLTEAWIYATESADGSGPSPAATEGQLAGVLRRQEGTIAGDDNWVGEFDIATHTGWTRKISVWLYGGTANQRVPGARVPPIKFYEAIAEDTGTGPTAPPSDVVVTFSEVGGTPRASVSFTAGDALASHRVFRNGSFLVRLAPGDTSFVDDGLLPGKSYRYDVQAVRNGQTSEFAGGPSSTGGAGGSTGSGTLAAPSFAPGYPTGGTALIDDGTTGDAYVNVRVANPNPGAGTLVFMSPDASDSGTFTQVADIPPGATDVTLFAPSLGLASGDTRWFYLVAVRPGYTDSAPSAHASTTFRPDT